VWGWERERERERERENSRVRLKPVCQCVPRGGKRANLCFSFMFLCFFFGFYKKKRIKKREKQLPLEKN
jgi:hypothetical protein